MGQKDAKQSAKMICNYLKTQPGRYSPDPKTVQKALNLTDAEFKSGLDYCVERKIIQLDQPAAAKPVTPPNPVTSVFSDSVKSVFSDDYDDDDEVFGGVKGTAEVAAVTS